MKNVQLLANADLAKIAGGSRLGTCGYGTAGAGAVGFLSGASLGSLLGPAGTIAGAIIGGIGSEFAYMGENGCI
ncbi:hypothetical protein DB330_13880 [Lacticaseibacillus casei]|uniref:Blp family class II bacteriocin n=1 Tax=Lacticaseibacillus TaxID=2759736 RepID=UPI000467F0C6|nr:Blp family class II bacteriocin [Lacticaseibacillus casei]MBI6598900.1 Blp family class II bacteriocin [Lacticaseibacillus casei]MCK2082241.1 Blp family class II bacteriocin [Lacticaseibacillus casei]MED7631947.1 hypothetical protein [Lacticaseibacillus casei]NIG81819.1 hypothetical protein [Lacticaseibacillus casei]PTU90390.1 hypothetical protein DB330_13880 [Lacticaseibacillus casei]